MHGWLVGGLIDCRIPSDVGYCYVLLTGGFCCGYCLSPSVGWIYDGWTDVYHVWSLLCDALMSRSPLTVVVGDGRYRLDRVLEA